MGYIFYCSMLVESQIVPLYKPMEHVASNVPTIICLSIDNCQDHSGQAVFFFSFNFIIMPTVALHMFVLLWGEGRDSLNCD